MDTAFRHNGFRLSPEGHGTLGFNFHKAATLFQTASARAAGQMADVAQAMIVTAWNIAIFGGAVAGGVILETAGAGRMR